MINNYQRGFIFNGLIGWVVSAFLLYLFWKIVLLGFLGLFFGGVAGDHNKLDVAPSKSGVVIGFFNGVSVSRAIAVSHRKKLQSRFGDKTSSGQMIQYQLFYNDSYGLMLDLAETYDQRMSIIGLGDRYELFWDVAYGDGAALHRAVERIPRANQIVAGMQKDFSTKFSDNLRAMIADKRLKTSLEHRRLIEQLTARKSKLRLILVAHSQGNLYALPAFIHASKRSKMVSVVHIAPPVDTKRGEYVLSSGDAVINSLRPNHVLPANITPPPCGAECADVFGHGFAEVYFNQNTEAGQKTAASIAKVLE